MYYCHYLVHRGQLLSAVVALLLGMPLSYSAYGQGAALNKDRLATRNAVIEATDRKRDGLNGSVRTVLTERVENYSPTGILDDGKRILVATAGYDLVGKKIYSTNSPTRPSATLPAGKVTRKTDGKGNLTELVIRGNDGMLLRKETYSYEFDKLGNWTKMTTFVWMSNGGTFYAKPVSTSFRTISYYSDEYYAKQAQAQPPAKSDAAPAPAKKEPERVTEQKPATRTAAAIQDLFVAKPNDKDRVSASKNEVGKASPSPIPTTVAKDLPKNNHAQRDNNQGPAEIAALKPNEPKAQNAGPATSGTTINDPKTAELQTKQQVSGGAVNKGPTALPVSKDADPARPGGSAGIVKVNVSIDETGKVTSAEVESGPSALWPAALQAALNSRFSPTSFSGRPTKVSASLNFSFADDVPSLASASAVDVSKGPIPAPTNAKDPSVPEKESAKAVPVKESAKAPVNAKPSQPIEQSTSANSNAAAPKDAAAKPIASLADNNSSNTAISNPSSNASTDSAAATPVNLMFKLTPADIDVPAPTASAEAIDTRPQNNIYKVGTGDVLSIQVPKLKSSQSTLFTIQSGGLLDYPAAGEPFVAAGMTTDEIGTKLAFELKRRALIEDDRVIVSVRDYSSHRIFISGLVEQPGAKVIQREAVPLFVLLAQAAPRPDAARAIITSATSPTGKLIDISDPEATGVLVGSGDAVHVVARPQEYIYIGGDIFAPGRKDFRKGVKLTQVLLESGGVRDPRHDKIRIKISRQDPEGRLVTTEYNLAEIEDGKIPDPSVQADDRIVAGRER